LVLNIRQFLICMTSDDNLELFKLDITDRKVLFWMMDHSPDSLRSWIEYIATQYKSKGKDLIDAGRLFQEVIIEMPDEESQQSHKTWRPKKILLVDDESIFNFLHKRMLELAGLVDEIHISLNGVQALDFLTTNLAGNLPDVILLDLSMPVMDGLSFIDTFNQLDVPNKEKISIVVITSSLAERDRLRAKELGIKHYLVKPVDQEELCAAVIGAA